MSEPRNSDRVHAIATALAAVFNVLVLLVICFAVMPRVNQSIEETRANRTGIGADILEAVCT